MQIIPINETFDAELHAIMEGVSLPTQHSDRSLLFQDDCAVALVALQDGFMDRSAYGHIIAEVKGL